MCDIQANVKKYEIIKINSKITEMVIGNKKITNINIVNGKSISGDFFSYNNKRKVHVIRLIR